MSYNPFVGFSDYKYTLYKARLVLANLLLEQVSTIPAHPLPNGGFSQLTFFIHDSCRRYDTGYRLAIFYLSRLGAHPYPAMTVRAWHAQW